jgi:hypothetical protein
MITKEQRNKRWREWYHKTNYSGYTVYYKKKRVQKLIEWYRNYKSQFKCVSCEESDIACLDFHHKDPSKKDIDISRAILNGWSIKHILAEIEKCEVVCANCHRKQVFKQIIETKAKLPPLDKNTFRKPSYIGHHGNKNPMPFNEIYELIVCEKCGKIFKRSKRIIRRQIQRGCKSIYCSSECYKKSHQKQRYPNIKAIQLIPSISGDPTYTVARCSV